MRQASEFLIRTLAAGYAPGTVLKRHRHDWGQLVYASSGVMTVETEHGTWVVPPQRAVWVPARTEHSISMSGRVAMRTLYLDEPLNRGLPARCSVLTVSPLLGELIVHAVASGPLRRSDTRHRHLVAFLLDQLREIPSAPLELPLPRDARALRLALFLRDEPGAGLSARDLARRSGASRRTLERLFLSETGMPLGRWRQQARLLQALRLLARGESVTATALEVGYAGTSAFVAAFSTAFGVTPGRYFKARE